MPQWMSEKLKPYQASIFDTIGQLVRERKCINLGQGFPDFDGPDLVKEAACQAIRDGHNQYAPLPGVPALTTALAEAYLERSGLAFDPAREITVLCGATEAMYCAITAVCEPGDEVIVFAPIYDTYVPTVQLVGARAVQVTLNPPHFRFDAEALRAAFNQKTKAIIVNTPHNPTGTVFNRAEMELIRDLCVEHDVVAITDEVYEYLTFDDHEHLFLASFEGMRERTITISSTAKSFSMTGWKVGYLLAPPEATLAIRRLHQFIAFAIATPLQFGMAAGIRHRKTLIGELREDLLQKRNRMCRELDAIGFRAAMPQGTYFVLADFSALSSKDDVDYAVELIKSEVSVATIPNSVFYMQGESAPKNYIRFCFAKKTETLERGLAQMALLGAEHG